MSHRYRPSSKCLRGSKTKKKDIWVTNLHNNIALSTKHLSTGLHINWGMCSMYDACVCACAPLSLRRLEKDIWFYLFIFVLPVNCSGFVSDVSGQLYAFHQCCQHWPAQHPGWIGVHGCQHIGQSSLQPVHFYCKTKHTAFHLNFMCSTLRERFLTVNHV